MSSPSSSPKTMKRSVVQPTTTRSAEENDDDHHHQQHDGARSSRHSEKTGATNNHSKSNYNATTQQQQDSSGQQQKTKKNENDSNNNASNSETATNNNVEYNPRWDGYTGIAILSLIEMSSVRNVSKTLKFTGQPGIALTWGLLSFAWSCLILILDRTRLLIDKFDYTKALDGKLEGYALLTSVLYWIVGVGFITQVDGIGYLTLNIYFSSWLCVAACIYTLNEWSTAKDILSIRELTGLSATLKSWYALFLSSLVVFGTSVNFVALYKAAGTGATIGICAGLFSAIMALLWICIHYKFFTECLPQVHNGGWVEFSCAFFTGILWIAAITVITQDGGVGKFVQL